MLRPCPRAGTHGSSPWHAQLHKHQRLRRAALPTTSHEVLTWAHTEFLELVSRTRQAARPFPLAKACLLLALEEQAMQQVDAARGETRTTCCTSTWDLTRLDALAHEVAQQLEEHSSQWHLGDTPQQQGQGQEQRQPEGSQPAPQHSAEQQALSPGQQGGQPPPQLLHPYVGAEVLQEMLHKEDTSTTAASSSSSSIDDIQSAGVSSSSSSRSSGVNGAIGADGTTGSRDGLVNGRHTPLQVLLAVNGVMFERHGYQACNRWGVSGDADMAAVMEGGRGSCAALCILYWEVCRRVGLPLAALRVEGGRYCIMWPASPAAAARLVHPGGSHGGHLVLDVYGEGALLTQEEVCELFELTPEDLSRPRDASTELLAALLSELVVTHWSQAVGCSPAPARMVPLSPATALSGGVSQLRSSSLRQAVAAAHKLVTLLPGEATPLLQYGVLLYLDGRFQDAWLELGSYLEAVGAGQYSERRQQEQPEDDKGVSSISSSSSSSNGGGVDDSEADGNSPPVQLQAAGSVQPPLGDAAQGEAAYARDGTADSEVAAAKLLMDRLQLELLVGAVAQG